MTVEDLLRHTAGLIYGVGNAKVDQLYVKHSTTMPASFTATGLLPTSFPDWPGFRLLISLARSWTMVTRSMCSRML